MRYRSVNLEPALHTQPFWMMFFVIVNYAVEIFHICCTVSKICWVNSYYGILVHISFHLNMESSFTENCNSDFWCENAMAHLPLQMLLKGLCPTRGNISSMSSSNQSSVWGSSISFIFSEVPDLRTARCFEKLPLSEFTAHYYVVFIMKMLSPIIFDHLLQCLPGSQLLWKLARNFLSNRVPNFSTRNHCCLLCERDAVGHKSTLIW